VQAFDEAMISRIHLALKYEPLGQDARKAVLEFFLSQSGTKREVPPAASIFHSPAEGVLQWASQAS
jgi:hypothetical protein